VSDAKARLRAEMRSRRARLSPAAAASAGAAVSRRLEALPAVAGARRVAAYRAVRGEIPLDALLDGPRREAFTVPRVVGDDLEFVAWCEGQSFAPGSFGIPEPVDGEAVAFADHDAVLVPLTAFDGRCRRLGQGGGFYDRALASLPSGAATGRPAAWASTGVIPKSSSPGNSNARQRAISTLTSRSGSLPRNLTVGPASARRSASARPLPTIRSGSPSSVQARTAKSIRL